MFIRDELWALFSVCINEFKFVRIVKYNLIISYFFYIVYLLLISVCVWYIEVRILLKFVLDLILILLEHFENLL